MFNTIFNTKFFIFLENLTFLACFGLKTFSVKNVLQNVKKTGDNDYH